MGTCVNIMLESQWPPKLPASVEVNGTNHAGRVLSRSFQECCTGRFVNNQRRAFLKIVVLLATTAANLILVRPQAMGRIRAINFACAGNRIGNARCLSRACRRRNQQPQRNRQLPTILHVNPRPSNSVFLPKASELKAIPSSKLTICLQK